MVRKFLPLTALFLMSIATAHAEDAALSARAETAATKACGSPTVYDGPPRLFYPQMYKAENEACIRMVSRIAIAKFTAAHGDVELIAAR